jgi:8-oxo-dGTP pyrophosphatase MutT (NUDIX family)
MIGNHRAARLLRLETVSPTVIVRRLIYRTGYRVLQVFWLIARPKKKGVKCVLVQGDRLLLVRHTYGRRSWDFPGGALKRDEPPLTGAQREMGEELGIGQAQWRPLGTVRATMNHRRDTVHCFEARLASPDVTLDLGELAVARWFPRDALPEDQAPYVRPVMAALTAAGPA